MVQKTTETKIFSRLFQESKPLLLVKMIIDARWYSFYINGHNLLIMSRHCVWPYATKTDDFHVCLAFSLEIFKLHEY